MIFFEILILILSADTVYLIDFFIQDLELEIN